MKRIFTLIATLFVAATVNAQTTTTTPVTIINQSASTKTVIPVEDLLVMKEVDFDFGKIPRRQRVHIGNHEKAVVRFLKFEVVHKNSPIVTDVQATGWPHAADNAFGKFGH